MSQILRKVYCTACHQGFSNFFLFYRTWGWPISLVRCRRCEKQYALSTSTFFGALLAWVISCSIIAFGGLHGLSFFSPIPLHWILMIVILFLSLFCGGFLASQIILRQIATQNQ